MAVVEQTQTRNQLQLGRIALTALAGLLWLLGFLSGKVALAVVWLCVAVKVGWMDARATSRRR